MHKNVALMAPEPMGTWLMGRQDMNNSWQVKDKLTGAGRIPTSPYLLLFHIDITMIKLINPRTSPRCVSAIEICWSGLKKSENIILPSYETNVVGAKSRAG